MGMTYVETECQTLSLPYQERLQPYWNVVFFHLPQQVDTTFDEKKPVEASSSPEIRTGPNPTKSSFTQVEQEGIQERITNVRGQGGLKAQVGRVF